MKQFYISTCLFSCFTILYAAGSGKPGCLQREEALDLLKTVDDLLTKAKESYPTCKEDLNSTEQSECGGKKPVSYIEISKKLITDISENFPTCPEVIVQLEKPSDCSAILASGHNKSGVYTIWPSESCATGKELQVYCDMETDYGGWTVIQRRGKFPVQQDFREGWESYKNGFGNITEEFWLGNENIRVLCYKGCEIRFDLQDKVGKKGFAFYKNFVLSRSSYAIFISDFTGNAGDGMLYINKLAFSTEDKGNTDMAKTRQGGWWYGVTNNCNLNGIYQPGKSGLQAVTWTNWRYSENLGSVEIKVRPK